jgi:hypothetical protein
MTKIDWSKFISLEYWLQGIAGPSSSTPVLERGGFFYWFFLYSFFIIFTTGIILSLFSFYLHLENPIREKASFLAKNIIWISIVGNFWFLFRQFEVGFLGARFWLLVLLAWFLSIVFYLLRYYILYFKFEYLYFKQKVLLKK